MLRHVVRNRYVFLADLALWLFIPVFLLAMRLESLSAVQVYWPALIAFWSVALPVKFATLWQRGLYQRYWRYASVDEALDIAFAAILAGTATLVLYTLVVTPLFGISPRLPRSTVFNDIPLTLLAVGGVRFGIRVFERARRKPGEAGQGKAVIIVGAGDAGSMIARELKANPQIGLEPAAFIDDDRSKFHAVIHGIRVEGSRADLERVARGYGAHHVIIAMPAATGAVIREIRDLCDRAKLTVKTVPGLPDLLSSKINIGQLRDVQIEDLLRREPVVTDQAAVAEVVNGNTVLVTGAGGSIGSELCRQIAILGARRMILLGHGENSIFDIHNELKARYQAVELIPVIADIRDERRMSWVFDTYRPKAVFHAAAHKHVPLMEGNPEEAITNNVGGTLLLLRLAARLGVSHFVFISTDKAVNPANVMGMTKLVAERLVHEFAEKTGEVFVSVRFGNVLGSRGSVVPFFQKQIQRGGPVTITHPDITRYFMTIPEAVQLVLQASALGTRGRGETFVLDMGEPVKIVDLAHDLIRLSGLDFGRDIGIVYTGLRPGEKMFEELFLDSEAYERTPHHKIFVAANGHESTDLPTVDALVQAAQEGHEEEAQRMLELMAPRHRRASDPIVGRVSGSHAAAGGASD